MASSSKKRALGASANRREEFANSQAGLNYGRSLLQAAGIDTSDFARLPSSGLVEVRVGRYSSAALLRSAGEGHA